MDTCSVLGGGSEARSAKLMEAPRRMWSRNWMSTSLRKSWRVGTWEGAARIGVRASRCMPLGGPVVAGEGVTPALAAERVVTAVGTKISALFALVIVTFVGKGNCGHHMPEMNMKACRTGWFTLQQTVQH